MRRNDKQITDQKQIEEILSNNTICRVALVDGLKPYILPMNYGYKNNSFYLHCSLEGKKLELIKKNNNVSIEVTDSIELVTAEKACGHTTKYKSVICSGTIAPVVETEQKIAGLNVIMNQHTGNSNWDFPEAALSKIIVLKIDIKEMTGKTSGF
jgi:nitroimidazol reductase NimA-like FMN-containing flavoprotein (pyridoxamine 5'-phosphate oxidase superfamily)